MPPVPPRLLHRDPSSSTNNINTNNAKPNTKILSDRDATDNPTHITHNAISIPSTYGRTLNPPNPGVVVGATLGAVLGFLLILYLIYLSLTSGRRFSASTIGSRTRSGTSTSGTPSEIVDVGFRPGFRSGFGGRRGRKGPKGPGPRRGGGGGGGVVVEESLTSGDGGGMVEVIEEESVVDPPPSSRYRSHSRSSRSSSSSRSRDDRYRRGSGVRGVDPMAYGGGSEMSGRS